MFVDCWINICNQSLQTRIFEFTAYLQGLSSLRFWIYRVKESPFLNLQDIYRVWVVSLYEFTAYLQGLSSLPFWICRIFTGSEQSPFLNLQHIYRVWAVSLFEFTTFTGSEQSPFLNLQDIYRLWTVSFFKFTAYLQGLNSLPFWIYSIFTGFVHSSLLNLQHIYMVAGFFISKIYRVFHGIYMFQSKNLHDFYSIFRNPVNG